LSRAPVGGVLVLGLGNDLMADDGFGSAVVAALTSGGLPPGVAAARAADVLALPSLWRGQAEVWLVDAVTAGGPPGAIHRFGHEELLALAPRTGSAHDLDLGEGLQWLRLALPALANVRFRLWGAEPARVAAEFGLSPAAAAAVQRVADEIRSEAELLQRRALSSSGFHPAGEPA
jgi:hydrogenase maturation protease